MSLLKPINVVIAFIYLSVARWQAYHRKKRSEYQLTQLDDHLLDDIGMKRVGDTIVPRKGARQQPQPQAVVKNFRTRRVRHPYQLRRRQE